MTGEREAAAAQRRVVLVTGLSGAGRTTALKALWSLMFENAVFKSFKTNLMAA